MKLIDFCSSLKKNPLLIAGKLSVSCSWAWRSNDM